jgi:hypothetical protein
MLFFVVPENSLVVIRIGGFFVLEGKSADWPPDERPPSVGFLNMAGTVPSEIFPGKGGSGRRAPLSMVKGRPILP